MSRGGNRSTAAQSATQLLARFTGIFSPAVRHLPADNSPAQPWTQFATPYEKGPHGIISPEFKDPRIPEVLNLLLLWAFKEACYQTMYTNFFASNLNPYDYSTTYTVDSFNPVLLGVGTALSDKTSIDAIMEIITTEVTAMTSVRAERLNVPVAQLAWGTAVENIMTAILKVPSLNKIKLTPLQALSKVMPGIFELFFTSKENPMGIKVNEFFKISAAHALCHPILLVKLYMLYDPFGIQLQRSLGTLPVDRIRLAQTLLRTHARKLPALDAPFATLNLAARGLTTHVTDAKEEGRATGLSLAAVQKYAGDKTKLFFGIPTEGNWAVLNRRLLEALADPDMEAAFHKHVEAAHSPTHAAHS
ncbi:MAG: hypothetical protein COB66_02400 [Coxiella sp. (in: Bacteria)]|nr:MAG: hypothetical protein COB66_02400 [Coxiella sp. (in: g-proteobacteria)]